MTNSSLPPPEATARALGDGLDLAVSIFRRGELAVTVWTLLVDGKRLPARLLVEAWPKDWGPVDVAKAASSRAADVREGRDRLEPLSGGALSAVALRALPMGALLDAQAEALRHLADTPSPADEFPLSLLRPDGARDHFKASELSALSHLPDAVLYVLAVTQGIRAPIQFIAERTGRNPHTVRTRLSKARSLGLLTKPDPGVVGGELTDFAMRLIELSVDLADEADPVLSRAIDFLDRMLTEERER